MNNRHTNNIGVRDLRSHLAAIVRRAGAGERIVVTVDGAPIAQVGPIDGDVFTDSIQDLVSRHLVIAPRRRGDFVPPPPLAMYSGVRVERAVSEIRA
jgi:prevent-host-death family protein